MFVTYMLYPYFCYFFPRFLPKLGGLLRPAVEHEGVLLEGVSGKGTNRTARTGTTETKTGATIWA